MRALGDAAVVEDLRRGPRGLSLARHVMTATLWCLNFSMTLRTFSYGYFFAVLINGLVDKFAITFIANRILYLHIAFVTTIDAHANSLFGLSVTILNEISLGDFHG